MPSKNTSKSCFFFEFPALKIRGRDPYFPPETHPVTLYPDGYTSALMPNVHTNIHTHRQIEKHCFYVPQAHCKCASLEVGAQVGLQCWMLAGIS